MKDLQAKNTARRKGNVKNLNHKEKRRFPFGESPLKNFSAVRQLVPYKL